MTLNAEDRLDKAANMTALAIDPGAFVMEPKMMPVIEHHAKNLATNARRSYAGTVRSMETHEGPFSVAGLTRFFEHAVRRVPTMVHIEGEIVIQRPVEDVFDFVADERNEPRYNPRMVRAEQISPGPIGVGTRFQVETRTMGRPITMTIEVTAYERPRRLASTTHLSSMDIEGTLTFDPVPQGTRMRWSWDLEPRGALKRLTPLVARMGRHQEETIWTSLKHFLEEQQTPMPSPMDDARAHA
ncbi:MAG TPA: SRPBCC family protein [Nitrolancea sp.]|nr:SRPBCC family protein [Nitrolancea sp.]